MTENHTREWAFAALVAGGVLILVGGLSGAMMMGAWGTGMMGFGMMGSYASSMTSWFAGMAWWMGVVGAVSGALVLVAAYRTRQPRADPALTGALAITGGALSLLAMGGWIVGAVLAIVGGALALSAPRAASPVADARP